MSALHNYEIESNGFTRKEVTEIREAVEKRQNKNIIKPLIITIVMLYIVIALINCYVLPVISNNPINF